mgnify:CR=1 FL=1
MITLFIDAFQVQSYLLILILEEISNQCRSNVIQVLVARKFQRLSFVGAIGAYKSNVIVCGISLKIRLSNNVNTSIDLSMKMFKIVTSSKSIVKYKAQTTNFGLGEGLTLLLIT